MLKTVFSSLTLLLILQAPAAAWDVLVVQHYRTRPYQEALRGFRSACKANIRELVLSELPGEDVVEEIRRRKPDLVLVVGMEALLKVRKIREIPIVYMMVLNPDLILNGENNITGISMNIPLEKQLTVLRRVFPHAKKIGFVYCRRTAGCMADSAIRIAAKRGIVVTALKAEGPEDFPGMLRSMKGNLDVYWMLPDSGVTAPDIVEDLILFSMRNGIPVFTFSDKYLKMGALVSLQVDIFKLGKRTGETAKKILSGTPVAGIPEMEAVEATLTVNYKIAEKMGIHINIDAGTGPGLRYQETTSRR
jgi:putative ABC transport system substrate-binding protein